MFVISYVINSLIDKNTLTETRENEWEKKQNSIFEQSFRKGENTREKIYTPHKNTHAHTLDFKNCETK